MTTPGTLSPLDCLDREQQLMSRLIDQCSSKLDIDPQHCVISLLQALGEISCTLNAADAGPERWQVVSYDLRKVLTTAAGIARV